jgi:hypothetical protein
MAILKRGLAGEPVKMSQVSASMVDAPIQASAPAQAAAPARRSIWDTVKSFFK